MFIKQDHPVLQKHVLRSSASREKMLPPARAIQPSQYVRSWQTASISHWAMFRMVVPISRAVLNAAQATSVIRKVSH
ncbi:unnamed protein product [Rotaria sp. Silwood1]|nr:unnamed protein product [Rotaria sp. Silwood1]